MTMNIRKLPALIVLLALVALSGLVASVDLTGCAGTPNRVYYQGAVASRLTVHEALGFYNVWVGEQHAKGVDTSATDAKVKDAFEKWKAAQLVALQIARENSIAISTNAAGQTGTTAVFEDAISNASLIKGDLFNLLTQIGVKLPTI